MARVVVPLDGSSLAERSLSCIDFLRDLPGVAIELVRVREAGDETASPETIAGYLEDRAIELGASLDLEVQSKVGHGIPYLAILDEAESEDVMMIAMTTHGRTGMQRHGVGSVTDKVTRLARCPTLVISRSCPAERHSIDRLILPVDGSRLAEEALPVARMLAERLHKPLLLLRVVKDEIDSASPQDEAVLAQSEAEATAYLAGLRSQLPETMDVEQVVKRGPVIETLVNEVRTHGNALLVMSSHGGEGFRSYALGRVSDQLLLDTSVPVLLVGPGQARRMALALGG